MRFNVVLVNFNMPLGFGFASIAEAVEAGRRSGFEFAVFNAASDRVA